MTAAKKKYAQERRYTYREEYQRRVLRQSPVREKNIVQKTQTQAAVSVQDKLLILVALIGAVFAGFVAATAYSAKIQYNVNTLNAQSKELDGEIENLNVKLKSAVSIQSIEAKALAMGMVYPQVTEYVYIEGDREEPIRDFALALKVQAYN